MLLCGLWKGILIWEWHKVIEIDIIGDDFTEQHQEIDTIFLEAF